MPMTAIPPPAVVVIISCPGLPAASVEKSITDPVESWVSQATGVQRVESRSRNGVSVVTISFKPGNSAGSNGSLEDVPRVLPLDFVAAGFVLGADEIAFAFDIANLRTVEGGFSSERDIAAITVNRWSHGYSYAPNSLFDGEDYEEMAALARKPYQRVAIANSDAGGDAYAHLAIDQAARAVRELS